MRIDRPCAPGMGFSTCPLFFDGNIKPQPPTIKATRTACPIHDMKGNYDRNKSRMVVSVKHGMRWGWGPSKKDPGVDIGCVLM